MLSKYNLHLRIGRLVEEKIVLAVLERPQRNHSDEYKKKN